MDDPSWRKMMLTLVTLVIVMILLVSGVLALRYRPPRRDAAVILYQKFVQKTGIEPLIGESPVAFAERVNDSASILDAQTVDGITGSYLEARYGDINPTALRGLERQVAALN